MSAQDAATLFKDGMTVGMSGFTRAGDCKVVPLALADRARQEPLQITLMTGARWATTPTRYWSKPMPSRGVYLFG